MSGRNKTAIKRPRLAAFDRSCFGETSSAVIGVDEAGRGCFAGPVIAAAVWMRRDFYETASCRRIRSGIRDSKELSPEEREKALRNLEKCREEGGVAFAAGSGSVEEIEEFNILGATRLAMKRALDELLEVTGWQGDVWANVAEGDLFFSKEKAARRAARPVILIDGLPLKPFFYPHQALVKGDGRSFAIAAASIVAKVTRDRLMAELHEDFPLYGFDTNKGYGTPHHLKAITRHGIGPFHREKFVRNLVAGKIPGEELEFDVEV